MKLTVEDYCNAGRFDGEYDALTALIAERMEMSERLAAASEDERQAMQRPDAVADTLKAMRARADAATKQKMAFRCLDLLKHGAHRLALDGYLLEHAAAYSKVFADFEAELTATEAGP